MRASFLSVVVCGSQTGPAAARPGAADAGWTDASHSIKMLQDAVNVRTNDDKGRMKPRTVEWEPPHYPTGRLSTQPPRTSTYNGRFRAKPRSFSIKVDCDRPLFASSGRPRRRIRPRRRD